MAPEAESFASYLEELKQNGGGLLITGTASAQTRAHVSRTLFGDVETKPEGQIPPPTRKRLLLRTDDQLPAADYLPGGVLVDDDDVRVVDARSMGLTRSAAVPPATEVADQFTEIEREMDAALADLIRTDAPEPGVLRIGVTSLVPLLEHGGIPITLQFLSLLIAKATVWKGVAHVHYPVSESEARGSVFTNFVDAWVQIRDTERGPEWLWHTMEPEVDEPLSWLPI